MTYIDAEGLFSACSFAPGTAIPKPAAQRAFLIKGFGLRLKEDAIIYYVPSRTSTDPHGQKGVTKSELWRAYLQLRDTDEFTRSWFNVNLSRAQREGACNFTTIGGLFTLLGIAVHNGKGKYLSLMTEK